MNLKQRLTENDASLLFVAKITGAIMERGNLNDSVYNSGNCTAVCAVFDPVHRYWRWCGDAGNIRRCNRVWVANLGCSETPDTKEKE